jgi:hypothetical protein
VRTDEQCIHNVQITLPGCGTHAPKIVLVLTQDCWRQRSGWAPVSMVSSKISWFSVEISIF